MIVFKQTHEQFQEQLRINLMNHRQLMISSDAILMNSELIKKIYLLDLSEVGALVEPLYSKIGRPARDPACMVRSLIIMTHVFPHLGFDDWVQQMRTTPLYAILSGFALDDIPGVGTFYDFLDRLWHLENPTNRNKRRKRMHKPRVKPKKKLKPNEKAPLKNPNIVMRLSKRLRRSIKGRFTNRADQFWQDIFQSVFVNRSAELQLLGPTGKGISVTGDGIIFRSASNPFGTKDCECRKEGKFNCDCPRRFSDPDASWGWDSYREIYVYGYSAYILGAADSKYDLPIFLDLRKCSRHDSVSFLAALNGLLNLSDLEIKEFIGDSAHDAYGIYEFLLEHGIDAIIALNDKRGRKPSGSQPQGINDYGIPICSGGHLMVYGGRDNTRHRIKWQCPRVRGKIKESQCSSPCSKASGGRVVYTKPDDDIRMHPKIPRASAQWKKRMAKRSGSERCNNKIKDTYGLKYNRHRTKYVWHSRLFLDAMASHSEAWAKHSELDMEALLEQWLQEADRAA